MPFAKESNIAKYYDPLLMAMVKFQINTPHRKAAFLAQIAHESGSLKYVEEIASGDAYDTRIDLGNTPEKDGDGRRYKGRGILQITGLANYKAVGAALSYDFVKDPEALELPGAASMSAGWFWKTRGLNELADKGDFEKISARINGINKKTGRPNGIEDRWEHWERAKKALNIVSA